MILIKRWLDFLFILLLLFVFSCQKEQIDEESLKYTVQILTYYGFEILVPEIDQATGVVTLTRPYAKGRIAPNPMVTRFIEPNLWFQATDDVEIYLDKVEEIVLREPGVRGVKWEVVEPYGVELFTFPSVNYTLACMHASLKYGDTTTFYQCFVPEAIEIYKEQGRDLFEELFNLKQPTGLLPYPYGIIDDSTMFTIFEDPPDTLVYHLTEIGDKWKIRAITLEGPGEDWPQFRVER
ncbi:MAG: hypothetical protein ACETWG_11695 [Candidatus Neomarinimicrobiota bacterium]